MKDSALNLEFVADLSLPVGDVPRAWYIDAPTFEPVRLGNWVGSVVEGGDVNFFNVASTLMHTARIPKPQGIFCPNVTVFIDISKITSPKPS